MVVAAAAAVAECRCTASRPGRTRCCRPCDWSPGWLIDGQQDLLGARIERRAVVERAERRNARNAAGSRRWCTRGTRAGPAGNSGWNAMPSRPSRRPSSHAPADVDETVLVVGLLVGNVRTTPRLLDDEPARVVVRSLQHRDRRGERQVRVARQRDRVVGGRPVPGEARRVRRARIQSRRLTARRRWRWRRCRWRRRMLDGADWSCACPRHCCTRADRRAPAARPRTSKRFSVDLRYGASYMDSPQDDAIADAIRAAKCRGPATINASAGARGPPGGDANAAGAARMLSKCPPADFRS